MISWFNNLRLSLTQWLLLSVSAVCGLLVLALRIQGSRLHKAQIDSLMAGIRYRNVAEDGNIDILRDRLEQEIQEYEAAK
jgi:hypothetical protein